MLFRELQTINIKARFKFYPYIVCRDKRELFQLRHFKGKRTLSFRKIKYSKKRNGYLINRNWVSRTRMIDKRNIILVDETIQIY